MKLKDISIGIFALVLVAALAYLWFTPEGLKRAPSITLSTLDGAKLDLDTLRGKPLLVTFWATSCPGCVKEIPHLIELHEEFSPRGLQVIGIAMSYDPPNHVATMREARKIPYALALDIDASAARAFGDVRLTPTSFLIAPDGRIVRHKIGEFDIDDMRGQIRAML
ncbi:MAG: peroxiredoxin family protein [Gammaproteobacteria bacterium]